MKSILFRTLTAFTVFSALHARAYQPAPPSQRAQSIPFDQLGAEAQKTYSGDGISIIPTAGGARLRAAFQKLEGQATREGLWLTSTADEARGTAARFRVLASEVGRACSSIRLPSSGKIEATAESAVFVRPGVIEEYRVSVDGVRQDFIIMERPLGGGELRLMLDITGAAAEAAAKGVKLTLSGSGRAIAYSRLHVTDATGKELTATMRVPAANHISVEVVDASAVYPIRIDPTFSDANWVSLNPGFPGAHGTVGAVVVDGGGNLYIGGNFDFVGTVAANRIAKWNGTVWSALGTGTDNVVSSLAVSGSDLYAGGVFTAAGGVANTSHIAKWNGSTWSALGTGANDQVRAIVVNGTSIYAGGLFTAAGGVANTGHIAKWNGSVWSAVGTGTNDAVFALAVSGTDLYAGGAFTTAAGTPNTSHIAKWNGSVWSALGTGMDFDVYALAASGVDLYAGGNFTLAGGGSAKRIAKWNGSAWSALASGFSDSGDVIYALAIKGTNVYAGGLFSAAGGVPANNIAMWDGGTWSALGSGITGFGDVVYALAASAANLFVGGNITTAGGVEATSIANWNGSTWLALGSGINANVTALAVSGADLYVGGDFTTTGGGPASHIAKWNGSAWTPLGSGVNNSVRTLVASGTDLYAGGDFTTAGGGSANRIAKWDGSSWTALDSGMNSSVYALAVIGGDLYVGGAFTTAGGTSANRIAKWNGSAWSRLGTITQNGVNGIVYAIAGLSAAEVYVGGTFVTVSDSTAASISSKKITKWNGNTNSWSRLGTATQNGTDNTVYAIFTVSTTEVYVGGSFITVADSSSASISAKKIAKWNGTNTWSRLGTISQNGTNSTVNAISALSNSEVYVGGDFSSVADATSSSKAANRIARWNGTTWSAMGGGVNNTIRALAAHGAGRLYLGGDFFTAGTGPAATSLFVVQGNIASDIAVEQPAGTGIADGGAKSFGSPVIGSLVSLSFTINNTGAGNLTGLGITKDGVDAGDFTVTASPTAPVLPGGNTTFTIQFAPTTTGAKSAAIHIANNVTGKNPYDISLIGTAVTAQENWRQTWFGTTANSGDAADLFDYDKDGLVNLIEYAFGLNPTLSSAGSLPPVTNEGGYATMTITKQAGVTYEVQSAGSLLPALPNSFSASTTTVLINDTTTLKVRDNVLISTPPARFMRVKVTAAP